MNKLFGIIGWSGSGKTDLICRLISSYKKKKLPLAQSNIPITTLK
tara:strand:+ start:98 stop:232 length:135 start_codon:yes stop_codon:yes gene_type:complete